ncbi:ATP-binding cassette domain-containing protein [Cryobacterium sp. Y50]|uniref:ATP-binding cassette domain-containing protein n=1 Tax=Cryobacterium sp. Y50 TaxID=2048286 RepID=UPI000CE40926|nr:ATP-binding cassette domain-containing protein [Cryobacterium sp. Y50]
MIEVDEVGVTAGDVTLLAPVSVRVQGGEALIVRGRNGTGKSTLLRVLAVAVSTYFTYCLCNPFA